MSSAAEERKAELLDLQRKLKTSTEEIQALQISAADAKQECDRFEQLVRGFTWQDLL